MFKFDEKTELVVKFIALCAKNAGINVYFVGGMVRDAFMGRQIEDIDILIEGSAIDFAENLKENSFGLCAFFGGHSFDVVIKSVHESFNTAKTVIDGIDIDFASTRKEEYPKSGCLPVVNDTGCGIDEDLTRRDFTVNAIASRILIQDNELCYEIIDPYFGKSDIKEKKLKILHNKSYIDDPTRILRGLDFKLRFGFDFSDDDKILIEKYLKSPDREGLSIDRVKLTIKKLFSNKNRVKAAYNEILENKYYKIWQDEPSFKKEWAENLEKSVEIFDVKPSEVFLAAIFDSKRFENIITTSHICRASNFEIYSFFKSFSISDLALYYGILGDESAIFYYEKLRNIKPDVTGDDLIKQGFTPGPKLGEELARLLKEKINSIK